MRPSPLPNRVDPLGALVATSYRGGWLGNRGGRFHDEATRSIRGRPWASRQWICCALSFKNRRRDVWTKGYTELFFMDEATALAAGHRPCFECRRDDAVAFAAAWGRAAGKPPPRAPEMDVVLHAERLDGRRKRLHRMEIGALPDGAMIIAGGVPHVVRGAMLLAWSFAGYGAPIERPAAGTVDVLTPPSTVAALRAGYRPFEQRTERSG